VHNFVLTYLSLRFFESEPLLSPIALSLLRMGVLPFSFRIPVSVTPPPLREHPIVNQLNSGPLCFMTEKSHVYSTLAVARLALLVPLAYSTMSCLLSFASYKLYQCTSFIPSLYSYRGLYTLLPIIDTINVHVCMYRSFK
jgi:hypothetical protein